MYIWMYVYYIHNNTLMIPPTITVTSENPIIVVETGYIPYIYI